jgi:hypothetical protein
MAQALGWGTPYARAHFQVPLNLGNTFLSIQKKIFGQVSVFKKKSK